MNQTKKTIKSLNDYTKELDDGIKILNQALTSFQKENKKLKNSKIEIFTPQKDTKGESFWK